MCGVPLCAIYVSHRCCHFSQIVELVGLDFSLNKNALCCRSGEVVKVAGGSSPSSRVVAGEESFFREASLLRKMRLE